MVYAENLKFSEQMLFWVRVPVPVLKSLTSTGAYTLSLITSRKVNRSHVGSIPTVPTLN